MGRVRFSCVPQPIALHLQHVIFTNVRCSQIRSTNRFWGTTWPACWPGYDTLWVEAPRFNQPAALSPFALAVGSTDPVSFPSLAPP